MNASQISFGRELKGSLGRFCLPSENRDSSLQLGPVNSISIFYFIAGEDGKAFPRGGQSFYGQVVGGALLSCARPRKKKLTAADSKCSCYYMLFFKLHNKRGGDPSCSAPATNCRNKMAKARQWLIVYTVIFTPMRMNLATGCLCLFSVTAVRAAATNEQTAPIFVPTLLEQTNNLTAVNSVSPATNSIVSSESPTNAANLGNITVIGNLDQNREQIAPSLGAVTYAIGQNQIQTMSQGQNSSFQQILLHAPGVVQDEFGEEHIRGDHGDIQYRINGVLLPESLNGFGQEIDPHMINSVTLITGTLPAQFGDRTAGIIDVTTRTGAQLNGSDISMYGGSYDTIHPSGSFGGTTSNLDYFVNVSYLHSNLGIDNPMDNSTPIHDITDQEKAFGYFSYLLDDTSRLTLLTSASYGDFEIPNTAGLSPNYMNSESTATPDSSDINDNQNEQNYYAVLSYQKSVGDFSGQLSAFTRYADIHFTPDPSQDLFFDGNAANIRNSDFANGVQMDSEYDLNDSHTLRAGFLVNYEIETLDTSSSVFPSSDQFSPSGIDEQLPTTVSPQSSTTPETIVANSGNNGLISGVYLQDEWHLYDGLTLNYGLRYDRFDVSFDHEDQVSPRANLVWQINNATTAHIGYARYFMPPTLQYIPLSYVKAFEYTTDAPFNDQDDPQKVERDHYFDAGISRKITPEWQVNVDSFCKLAKQLLDDGQFGSAVILNNFNYSSGIVYGAELSSIYKRGPFSAYGNFSYVQTWAKDIDSMQNEFPNNELSYLTTNSFQLDHQGKFTGSGGVSYILMKNTLLHSDFLYGNGLRAGFANLEKLPSYWTFNAGIEYVLPLHDKYINELKFRFDCLNLFNQTAELRNGTGIGIAAAAYGPCRSYYGGITAVF